jgi:hypothetical protein
LSSDVYLPHVNNNLNWEFSYRIIAAVNYTLVYNILSTHDWSSVYAISVDVAVASLNAAVRCAMVQAIPCGFSRKSKFSPSLYNTLRYYFVKKHYFHHDLKRKQSDYFYDKLAYYGKLDKALSSLAGLNGSSHLITV